MSGTERLEGIWWLPTSPRNRVGGTLSFERGEATYLTYVDVLDPRHTPKDADDGVRALRALLSSPAPSVIHGDVLDGNQQWRHVTLFASFKDHLSYDDPSRQRMRLHVQVVLFGLHLADLDEAVFDVVSVRLSGMDSWIGRSPIAHDFDAQDGGVITDVFVRYRRPDLPSVEVAGINARLSFNTAPNLKVSHTDYNLEYHPAAELALDQPIGVRDLMRVSGTLHDYFTITSGTPMSMLSIMAATPGVDAVVAELSYESEWPWQLAPAKAPTYVTSFAELGNPPLLAASLASWFKMHDEYRPAIALLVDNLYRNATRDIQYRDTELLNLVQVAEGVHRRRFPNEVVPKSTYRRLLRTVKSRLDDADAFADVSPDVASRMRRSLNTANGYLLEERLRELIQFVGAPMDEVISSADDFVTGVVLARNSFAHRLPSPNRDVPHGARLYALNLQLRCLLLGFFLRDLGIGEDELRRGFQRYEAVDALRKLPAPK